MFKKTNKREMKDLSEITKDQRKKIHLSETDISGWRLKLAFLLGIQAFLYFDARQQIGMLLKIIKEQKMPSEGLSLEDLHLRTEWENHSKLIIIARRG